MTSTIIVGILDPNLDVKTDNYVKVTGTVIDEMNGMKEKIDDLEVKKANLTIKLEEAKLQAKAHAPTEEKIRKYLQKDADIKNKSPEKQKRIIQTYVKKVIVYENTIDINTIVTLAGGGEGNRTPVRRCINESFSERSY
jgi:site-specific DNA recombinase